MHWFTLNLVYLFTSVLCTTIRHSKFVMFKKELNKVGFLSILVANILQTCMFLL